MTTRIHSFHIGADRVSVLFTRLSSSRLTSGPGLESIDQVICEVLDANMVVMAEGRALRSESDTFSLPKGIFLSMARAMDDAETRGEWTNADSARLFDQLFAAYPECDPKDTPAMQELLRGLDVYTHTAAAQRLLPYVGAPEKTPDVPMGRVIPTSPGRSAAQKAVDAWKRRSQTTLTTPGAARLVKSPTDGGQGSSGSPVYDMVLDAAARYGVKLDTPEPSVLSLDDLSRLWKAMTATESEQPVKAAKKVAPPSERQILLAKERADRIRQMMFSAGFDPSSNLSAHAFRILEAEASQPF